MTNTSPKTPVVSVLGMHRSGTSAGMNVLSALGVACGEDLIPAGRSNLAGFWEHAEIVAIQEKLLAHLDRVWHGPRGTFPLPEGWLDSRPAREAEAALTEVVRREIAAHSGRVWGYKDPRTMRLWPLWERIWDRLAIAPIPVVMVRHPDAVIRSLAKHNGISPSRGLLVWLQHNVEALRHIGDRLSLVVDFDQLVNNPDATVERMVSVLGETIEITDASRAAAVSRVSTGLRTHPATSELPSNMLAARVYSALTARAAGKGSTEELVEVVQLVDAATELFSSWRTERPNVLTDWIVRFLVSRRNG